MGIVVLALLGTTPPPPARALPGTGPPPQLGTVDTVAGPGFCDGPTVVDRASTAVGSMALNAKGDLFVDMGPPARGMVARVPVRAAIRLIATTPRPGATEGARVASRLAPDVADGVLAAAGDRLLRVFERAETIAGGRPAAQGDGDGDGGPAAAARFQDIGSVATDRDGNAYVADVLDAQQGTVRIRFVNRTPRPVTFYRGTSQEITIAPGAIDTIAGARGQSLAGDGGPARAAVLQGVPPALAVAGDVLYLAWSWPPPPSTQTRAGVRAVNLSGAPLTTLGVAVPPAAIATVAGGGPAGFGGDGGPALSASVGYVPGIAATGTALLLADRDHHRIRRVDEAGVITTIAGAGGAGPTDGGFNGNDRPAASARLDRPFDVKLGPEARVFISDSENGQVRYIDPAGTIRVAPGAGATLAWRCLQPEPDRARGGNPHSLTVDPRGNVYFLASGLPQVKRLDGAGVVTSVAGVRDDVVCGPGPPGCDPGDGGPAGQARLYNATSIVADGVRGLYVYDGGHRRARYVNLSAGPVTVHGVRVAPGSIETVAGDGSTGDGGDGGPARAAQLSDRAVLALTSDGHLFISEIDNTHVRVVDAAGTITAVEGCCLNARAITVDTGGNLYVFDGATRRVWFLNRGVAPVTVHGQVVPAGARVAVAGDGAYGFAGDGGPALEAQFIDVSSIAVDGTGNLYLAHNGDDHTVRRVDGAGMVGTVVGTGNLGFSGDGLVGNLTTLNTPGGVAVDSCGNLFVADTRNDRIRRLTAAPDCELSAPVAAPGGGSGRSIPSAGLIAGGVAVLAAGLLLVRRRRRRR